MSQQRRTLVIQLSATQVSAGPFPLDYRWSGTQNRTIAVSVATSTVIKVLASPVPMGESSPLNVPVTFYPNTEELSVHSQFFTTISAFSASGWMTLEGPWAQVKVERVLSTTAATGTVYITT